MISTARTRRLLRLQRQRRLHRQRQRVLSCTLRFNLARGLHAGGPSTIMIRNSLFPILILVALATTAVAQQPRPGAPATPRPTPTATAPATAAPATQATLADRKSTRLNSSH